jgi:RNA polymerase sigma factor (sigma-70 family)
LPSNCNFFSVNSSRLKIEKSLSDFQPDGCLMGEMQDKSDVQLLRDYAERRDESAFREIVARHTDFVYSAALRQVESADLAADIAQGVFVDLARKAKPVGERLTTGTSLAGWLHRGTRYAALNHLRDTRRRLANERQAMEQLLTNSESSADWEQIRPALDEALDTLGDEDREALLLRYFKNQDFRTVGLALGVNDDAAQKRVSRAVERLREFFSNRKLTVGASGLAVLISANAVQAAPVGLAATISITAILAGTAVSTSTVIAATKAIAMTTLQKTLVTATLAVVAGAGIYEAHQATQLRRQNQTLQQEQAPLAEQIQKLQRERDEATNRLAELFAENARLKSHSNENELLKLRGEVGVLRAQLASAKSLAAKPDLTALPSSYATNDGSNQAMLDYLGNPTPPPPNFDAAYSKEGLISALQNAAQAANISLKKIVIDDSEFPFLVGVEVENKSDLRKLKDQMATMGGYNYTGGVGGNTSFVMNITPFDQYPAGRKHDIDNRLSLRELMLSDKMDTAN